ncbi:MAG: MmgE/PrpD family protein [Vulcanimicrobiaceae bacterium]|jgi:2-methylcitrate dehydratase PrpD
MSRVANEFGAWASQVRWDDLPSDIQHHARTLWMDSFGCMLLGSHHPETRALAAMLEQRSPDGRLAAAVGPTQRLQAADAVLLNGLAMGVDVYDGGNVASRGHVAGYVMPAVLTAAELTGATFGRALAAFVVGYEVAARIGYAGPLRPALHPSGTWGMVGAAAAVGYLRGMSASELALVMELAANLTLATSWDAAVHGANVRSLYATMPSYLGTLAADLSSAGFRGGPSSIEVTFGEISSTEFVAERALADLGSGYVMLQSYSKRYPNCRNFHGALDAAFAAREALPLPFDAERDVVRVGTDMIAMRDNAGVHADSPLAARESLPICIAMALIYGRFTPEMYLAGDYAREDVVRLARRIHAAEAPRPTPTARPGWVEIAQRDGSTVRREVLSPSGDPTNPIPLEALREKFVANARPIPDRDAMASADAMLNGPTDVSFADAFMRWLGATVTTAR